MKVLFRPGHVKEMRILISFSRAKKKRKVPRKIYARTRGKENNSCNGYNNAACTVVEINCENSAPETVSIIAAAKRLRFSVFNLNLQQRLLKYVRSYLP